MDGRFGQPVYPFSPSTNRIKLLPENFLVAGSAQPISRRDFLTVLANLTSIMVRASYSTEPSAVYRSRCSSAENSWLLGLLLDLSSACACVCVVCADFIHSPCRQLTPPFKGTKELRLQSSARAQLDMLEPPVRYRQKMHIDTCTVLCVPSLTGFVCSRPAFLGFEELMGICIMACVKHVIVTDMLGTVTRSRDTAWQDANQGCSNHQRACITVDLKCKKKFCCCVAIFGYFILDVSVFCTSALQYKLLSLHMRGGCCINALCLREKHTQAEGRGREHAATQAESGHSYMIFTLSDRQAQMPLRVFSGSG